MEFFNSAVDTLQTIVVGLGGALCVWGGVNLLEGYGADNPASKSQGIKQLVAGGGVALGIQVDAQNLRAPLVQAADQRGGGGGFADAALLIGNGNNLRQGWFPPYSEMQKLGQKS